MIRKATIRDIKAIHGLLQIYGEKGELLPRPLSALYDHLRDFFVFQGKEKSQILGCCALQFCWEDLAEIRSLAVHPDHLNKKIGSTLTEAALSDAAAFNVRQVFTLTYKPEFFQRYDFSEIDRSELPLKIWSDCILCIKFPDCDEIAMIKYLN